jgi:hypothetical protein
MSGQFTSRPFYSREKSSRHPLDKRQVEPQTWYGRYGEMQTLVSVRNRKEEQGRRAQGQQHLTLPAGSCGLHEGMVETPSEMLFLL